MRRWTIAVSGALLFSLLQPAASANTSRYAGSGGIVAGAIRYDSTLPGLLSMCKWKLGFAIALDSPAFVLRDGDKTSVGAMTFAGRGVTNCASEALEGGRIDGRLTFASRPDFTCRVTGHYTRVVTDLSWVATTYCDDAGTTRAPFNWIVRLQKAGGALAGLMDSSI